MLKPFALLALRVSVALLVLLWGVDKIVDPAHAMAVSDGFYRGLLSVETLMPVLGDLQVGVSLLAACLALLAFQDQERFVLDRRRSAASATA